MDDDVTFDLFVSQIRCISGSGCYYIKIIYSLKCEAILVCAHEPAQKDLTVMLYLHDLYNVNMIYICR